MLTTHSKVVWIVAVAYLTTFFALASGLINALIEGRGINRFMIPSRSAQTIGETVVITLILFMGMAGAPFPYYIGYLQPSSAFGLEYAVNSIAMPMIDSYDVILCETSPGCVFDWQQDV